MSTMTEEEFEYYSELMNDSHAVLKLVPSKKRTFEICKIAIVSDPTNMRYVPNNLIVKVAEAACPDVDYVLAYIPLKYKTPDLCYKLVNARPTNIYYVPKEHLDKPFCTMAIEKKLHIGFVPKNILDQEMCNLAVKLNPDSLGTIPPQFLQAWMFESNSFIHINRHMAKHMNKDMFMKAIKSRSSNITYVPVKMMDMEMCKVAIGRSPRLITHIPAKFRCNELFDYLFEKFGSECDKYGPPGTNAYLREKMLKALK